MGKPWDATYERLSINFVCVQGDDIIDNGPVTRDDEEYLTVDIPRKLSRCKCIIVMLKDSVDIDLFL